MICWCQKRSKTLRKQRIWCWSLCLPLLVALTGEAYIRLNKLNEAEHWYRESLRAKPDHIPAHLTYGKLLAMTVRSHSSSSSSSFYSVGAKWSVLAWIECWTHYKLNSGCKIRTCSLIESTRDLWQQWLAAWQTLFRCVRWSERVFTLRMLLWTSERKSTQSAVIYWTWWSNDSPWCTCVCVWTSHWW